ncbi:MAG: tRNA (5-methylaminomethyl-2-thiouridine)(34)-methyltransferase MnmD [Methylotenera sp.]|nr:tRNA (5-methylaminomethyl-2-thiouridine)(34)-methyltransferase MnmD [Methylotenera sp.]
MRTLDNTKIEWCQVEWKQGQPFAGAFQDVYFSSDHGVLETEHVFLQGNDLSNRWQQLNTDTFTIAETGFGTGLNFLCAAKLWLETAPKDAILNFTSVEKYPLTLQDITTALKLWPELSALSLPLLKQYTTLIDAKSISLYGNSVQLNLLIGDATEQLARLQNKIDAWFLDGFSPAKNPDMWQPALFEQMTRLSHQNTTFATFTSAGMVRRGLISAGFKVNKRSGFGKKREMIDGYLADDQNDSGNNSLGNNRGT